MLLTIREAVLRAIAEQYRSIRLPMHMVETVARLERKRLLLAQRPLAETD